MTQPARKPLSQCVAYIGREIDFTDGGYPGPWAFGCLPGGCTPNAVSCLISNGFVFDVGTDYSLAVGTKILPARWFEQGFSGSGASRVDRSINADVARPMALDAECFVQLIPPVGATKLLAGHAVLWLSYLAQPLLTGSPAIKP